MYPSHASHRVQTLDQAAEYGFANVLGQRVGAEVAQITELSDIEDGELGQSKEGGGVSERARDAKTGARANQMHARFLRAHRAYH